MEKDIEAEISGALARAFYMQMNTFPNEFRDIYNALIKWIVCSADISNEKSDEAGRHFYDLFDNWGTIYGEAMKDPALSREALLCMEEGFRRLEMLYQLLIQLEAVLRDGAKRYREDYSIGAIKLPPISPWQAYKS